MVTESAPPNGRRAAVDILWSTSMNARAPEKFRDPALVDFGTDPAGEGRRLERLGGVLVDRPLPQATGPRRSPGAWAEARAVFRVAAASSRATEVARGTWDFTATPPAPWLIEVPIGRATLSLEVRPAPSGQLGVFLEQVEQWRWLARTARPGTTLLSLFGHSGAASLAAAAAGAEVTHVDASRQAIALARRNAEASGLAHLPVAWICEDAATFVARCLRRGRRFSGVVLDPPSWGHGPKGQPFAIDRDLPGLLADVARLLDPAAPGPVLVTCHSSGWHPRRLVDTLSEAFAAAEARPPGAIESGALACRDDAGRSLELGTFVRTAASP
jgi:23S rRNA (cytosine1962-C5)-methyltransferase